MIDIFKAFEDERLMKSLTGFSRKEFDTILPIFKSVLDENKKKNNGPKHTLLTTESKLFYVLFYLKCYPTYDLAGAIYGVNRSQTCRWFDVLKPILEKTLKKELVLPKRNITKEDFSKIFTDTKEVFLDGTERVINRPKDNEEQRLNYSGKKKQHTHKNLILTDRKRRILVLTKTVKGKNHDYGIFKENDICIPDNVTCWVDLGFKGIEKDYPELSVIIPKKKSKGLDLNESEKMFNKSVSQVRVISEHANAGVKRMNCVSYKYRSKKEKSDDFMLLSCGIWNYHIKIAS